MLTTVLEQKERIRKSSKADVERFIEESELKIASLESRISALVKLCDRERACVAALRHLISPIHTLPVELLAEIFDLTILNSHYVQVTLVKNVAHRTPRLWTRPIQIDLQPSRSGDRNQVYVDGLKAWLVRSAPLTVPVSLVPLYGRGDHPISDEVLRTSPRWRSLHLIGANGTPLSFIGRLAGARLDNVEELDLGLVYKDNETIIEEPFPSSTVPQLRKLGIHFCSNALSILMPWAQLTDLTLRADFANIAHDVLGQCPNLVRAAVNTAAWDVLPEARQDILIFSHLHFLSFDFFGNCVSISRIRITSTSHAGHKPVSVFQLRAPNITQLDLWYSSLEADDLTTALRHAPSLTSLKVNFCPASIDDALIDALYYHKAGAIPLAPNLRILGLAHIGVNFTRDILARMIASRWWTDTELAACLVPPVVSRWTRVELQGGSCQHVINIVLDLSPDVPISYYDHD
ncbi:hypothetical protein B0H12DRAFT_1324134 [Mycena haematopus]|nr:hypothetical protein B0H12DRAFT_1324134 [Mycena haematopus]